jgi:hypothetical protein
VADIEEVAAEAAAAALNERGEIVKLREENARLRRQLNPLDPLRDLPRSLGGDGL